MKLFKKALVGVAVAAAFAASAPVSATTLAIADMNIFSLGLVNVAGVPFGPANGSLTIVSESRTGTADSSFNGVVGAGAGAGSITSTVIGATVDVGNRCAGNCAGIGAALYGGVQENNNSTHLLPPGSRNFALGDMFISGNALGGGISGLVRADAATVGATNSGGSNATIKNAASIQGAFTVGGAFTGSVAIAADWFIRAYVDSLAPVKGTADAGFGWNMRITSADDAGFATLVFAPGDLNQSYFSTQSSQNQSFQDNNSVANSLSNPAGGLGQVYVSDVRTFNNGKTYNFSINQSSNAAVSEIPEPTSLALLGLGLLGLAAARRRKSV